MTSQVSKKQICMGGGYMLNSGEMVLGILTVLGGLFAMMLSFYILLCFIQFTDYLFRESVYD